MNRNASVELLSGAGVSGEIGEMLKANDYDLGVLRPYKSRNGKSYVTRTTEWTHNKHGLIVPKKQKKIITNAPTTLTTDSWKLIDKTLMDAALAELTFWDDLEANVPFVVPDGFSLSMIQSWVLSDFGSATISMDPAREGDRDRPQMDSRLLPLPVIHADFQFNARERRISARAGLSLDLAEVKAAGRKIAEKSEALALGTLATYTFDGISVYGMANFPQRLTYSMQLPTTAGWTPNQLVTEFLAIKTLLRAKFRRGPYTVYVSPFWDEILDNDYSQAYAGGTLRGRLEAISRIGRIVTVETLTGSVMFFLQLTEDVVRAVVGMPLTGVRWPEKGGMSIHYKAMTIRVPEFRRDYSGNVGVLHATAV